MKKLLLSRFRHRGGKYPQISRALIIMLLMCFCGISYAKTSIINVFVPGIYTGQEFINGNPAEEQTFVFNVGGTLTETSTGQTGNESAGTGSWRYAPGGGIDIVQIVYTKEPIACSNIGIINGDPCAVVLGYHATVGPNGILNATSRNVTIRTVFPAPPFGLNLANFATITLQLKRQSFDSWLNGTP